MFRRVDYRGGTGVHLGGLEQRHQVIRVNYKGWPQVFSIEDNRGTLLFSLGEYRGPQVISVEDNRGSLSVQPCGLDNRPLVIRVVD